MGINCEKNYISFHNFFFNFIYCYYKKFCKKKNEDKIFTVKENIRVLNSEFERIKLEFDYLSSSDKLLEFQSLYFENNLLQKKIENIKIFKITNKDKNIENLKIVKDKW